MKRRKLGVLGPENNKIALIHIDDLNMPKKEQFGAQPALELLRQWFNYEGWYDMHEFEFKNIVDIFFLSSMGLPGGGRTELSVRFTRNFNLISYTNYTNESINYI